MENKILREPEIGDILYTNKKRLTIATKQQGVNREENCFLIVASDGNFYMVTNGLSEAYWIEVVDEW